MNRFMLLAAAGGAAVLFACEGKIGLDDGNAADPSNGQVSAEGKAEEGKISIKAPGFDIALSVPREMAREARPDHDNKLLYPGVTIGGVHIAAGEGPEGAASEVEMRFASSDPPERIAAWYRDPARAEGFALTALRGEGDGFVVTGTQKSDNHGFKVHLGPRSGGGTEGRLIIRHRD